MDIERIEGMIEATGKAIEDLMTYKRMADEQFTIALDTLVLRQAKLRQLLAEEQDSRASYDDKEEALSRARAIIDAASN